MSPVAVDLPNPPARPPTTAWRPRPAPPATAPRPARRFRPGPQTAGLALALASFFIELIWVAAIRPLNAPDEPAYLQTLLEVRHGHLLPEIHFDFQGDPAGEVVGTPGDPTAAAYAAALGYGDPIRGQAMETVQPPLYFWLAAPVLALAPPDPVRALYLGRLVAALFGAGTVYACWAATRQLAPRAPMWAVAVGAVVALLPEACFDSARVGNDSLVNCAGAAACALWFRGLREPGYDRWMWRSGGIVGLALLAKLNALVLLPGLLLVVLFRAGQVPRDRAGGAARLRRGLQLGLGAFGSSAAVAGWWFLRNLLAYGEPSGTSDLNRFFHAHLPSLNGADPAARADFVYATWLSFWGFFGWQNVPMPDAFYAQTGPVALTCGALSALALILLGGRHLRRRRPRAPAPWQAAAVLALVVVVLTAGFVANSLVIDMQAQGRYFFLALLPAALVFTGGLYWLPPGRTLKALALAIPILWLAVYNAVGVALVR